MKSWHTWAWKVSRDHLCQVCCPKEGQPEQVPQGHVQSGINYLQGWTLNSLLGQTVHDNPDSKKVVFWSFKWNLFYFSLCRLLFVILLGTTETSLSFLSSLFLPMRCSYVWIRFLLSLLLSSLNSSICFSFSSFVRCFIPDIISVVLQCSCSSTSVPFLHCGTQNWTQDPERDFSTAEEGMEHHPQPASDAHPSTAPSALGLALGSALDTCSPCIFRPLRWKKE